mmetsp:Transcript_15494/g.24788  ORF Transcript_15494/g.24788 Transcript_15494/m.24788 type:complete len:96 (+) Transcript_15494:88-375(+)|eukprot:CAMPEP_0115048104 /NCGR_PEP_ID=MMETSP0227-20121206/367_1 /TAXON_ID=89957 /ORGANISM="Polarella glacialis, Strain CCMP 1383" /LENGTH=95 /DNA_ID=CAMNT_0002431459 /DNA_START=82 /DNA_END=369 /DNA_ORIENTATION=+
MTVAIKLLEPLAKGKKPAGFWEMSKSIHAKDVFAIEADHSTEVLDVKARVAAATSLPQESLRVILFGKVLDDRRTLGSYGLGNIEDPVLHVLPNA